MKIKNMHQSIKIDKHTIFVILAMIFFTFTMVYQLTHSALWGDEWVEYLYSQASLQNGEMYEKIISTFQPPLYNVIMHFWLKIDQTVLWFRLFNVFIGFFCGIFLYLTVKKLATKKVALFSVLGLSVCYQWIYCIQECSEYALMLFFVFAALYLFVSCLEKFSYWKMALFILTCVGAIYSQYGSVFVVLPLLLLFFFQIILDKNQKIKAKIILLISYIGSLLAFALPLYLFFLKQQMANNAIGENTATLTLESFVGVFLGLGRMIVYFFSFSAYDVWYWIGGAITIFLGLVSAFLFVKMKENRTLRGLILTLWCGYIAHYFLVELHIYAMIHADESRGLFSRYSYFYIPILVVLIPVLLYRLYLCKFAFDHKKYIYAIGGAMALCMCMSLYTLHWNWYKAKDNVYAEIWLENNGWEDPTYLCGNMAPYGFDYYVSHSDLYKGQDLSKATTEIDVEKLPPKFWAWRCNWNGNIWYTLMDTARASGYSVTVYDDSGFEGQLAYCEYIDE